MESGSGVVAIDGTDGSQMWRSEEAVRMITVARFADLDEDGTLDVLVGGRGVPEDERPLIAISGIDGSTIWRVDPIDPAWGNVFTPQSVGDVTGDGVADWIVATGGDHIRAAMEPPTVAGRLIAIDGATGQLEGSVALPEPQEIYNSPVIVADADGRSHVLVGSGGEVFPGSVWRIPVDAVLQGQASGFEMIMSGEGQSSFIAPFSVGDLDGDGRLEVAVVRMDGRVSVLDPFGPRVLWEAQPAADDLAGMKSGSAILSLAVPAIGQLDEDPSLEVVTQHELVAEDDLISGSVSSTDSVLVVFDGTTGLVQHELSVRSADSVQSPLIATTESGHGVVCACVRSDLLVDPDDAESRHATRLGWWVPGGGDPEDLGLPASLSITPAFSETGATGGSHVLVSGGTYPDGGTLSRSITASRPEPAGEPIVAVEWGGYMGSTSTGHYDR
ncbi:MAG: VCBS repeat-containing protein [Microthrixaceae bacterium]